MQRQIDSEAELRGNMEDTLMKTEQLLHAETSAKKQASSSSIQHIQQLERQVCN